MKNPVLFILFQLLMLECLEMMKIKKPTIFIYDHLPVSLLECMEAMKIQKPTIFIYIIYLSVHRSNVSEADNFHFSLITIYLSVHCLGKKMGLPH